MKSERTYHAEYSNTDGQMWIRAGEFESEKDARNALKKLRKAGNITRVVAISPGHVLGTVTQLVERGDAEIL